ncbi:MAG TPA: crosslink repair DNA glycosylase YcaQ family protein [Trueperaceae bacterium]|nr:crosslink repair DNA glycosylase YcaQ family protein [Trueperaceae bacterium]
MHETLSAAQARRIFLAAQGLARKRPAGRVGDRQFRDYLERQGVLQLDSVNVLTRAHYLPLYSRYGPYPHAALDDFLWSSGEAFEHWGHEASVMPRRLLPLMRFRMDEQATRWSRYISEKVENARPGLVAEVERAVIEKGPLTAADLSHLEGETGRKRGTWWDWTDTKQALDYLFLVGRVAVAGRPNFQRVYGSPTAVWGELAEAEPVAADAARQALFEQALGAAGIGTVNDLADHFRIKKTPAKRYAKSAVERGLANWVKVEGWKEPALLARGASDPGRATGAALLAPFDPAVWYRERLLRMFGMHYRIEIYTPAPKRVYGYYTLPFLLGDQMVARADLKADRKASRLMVKAAWLEERPAPGSRRRSADEVAAALNAELRLMATWLDLDEVTVEQSGTLASALGQVSTHD